MSKIFNSIKVSQEVKDEVDKSFTDIENTYELCQRITNKNKMKLQLIMLKDPIIVSDGEIKEGDLIWYKDMLNLTGTAGEDNLNKLHFSKIIAQSHQIDWNGLEAKFGYVDVEKLTLEAFKQGITFSHKEFSDTAYYRFKTWFSQSKIAQELNDKKFSLEDIEKAIKLTRGSDRPLESIIKELSQPKIFDIEVEIEMKGVGCEAYKCNHPLDPEEWNCDSEECQNECKMLTLVPKVTEDKIKITKKL